MAQSEFLYVTFIRTTPEKLWQALTEPEFTRKFWCDTVQDCAWEVGASWKLMAPSGRVADSGEVVEIDPPKKLVLTWQNQLFPEATAEGFSKLTYLLEPEGDVVKFTVRHSIEKENAVIIQKVSGGWPRILAALKSLLETGQTLPGMDQWPKGL